MRNDQLLAHADFEATIPPESIARWRIAVEAWEENASLRNPYKGVRKSMFVQSYA